ncbi:MAG TPA: hypothetical protein DCQ06_00955, partial [Myxococcales bacterium]|nr:hypothetical protein [Myxococcales bacterium]
MAYRFWDHLRSTARIHRFYDRRARSELRSSDGFYRDYRCVLSLDSDPLRVEPPGLVEQGVCTTDVGSDANITAGCQRGDVSHNVLYISRHFPPEYNIGGKRAWRFARHLGDLGWGCTVVTADAPPPNRQDPTPLDLPAGVTLSRTYWPTWYRQRGALASDPSVGLINRSAPQPSWVRRMGSLGRVPVGRDLWLLPRQAAHLARLAKSSGADVIYASGSPHASLVFAQAAAKKTGLPLVVELRDPWSLSPFTNYPTSLHRLVERRAEAQVIRAASRVVFTSETTTEAYRQLYCDLPPSHFVTIRNSFEPHRRPQAIGRQGGPFELVHFGSCYRSRRLQDVIEAVAMLRDRGHDPKSWSVLNLGRMNADDIELAESLGLPSLLRWRTAMPYAEGLELLAGADALLLLAYGKETQFLPGKLYDYLLVRRPILTVASPSELTAIIDDTRTGSCYAPGQVKEIADWLEGALMDRDAPFAPDDDKLSEYEASRATAKLVEV